MVISKKNRKHSGWQYPDCTLRTKKIEIINDCLDPQPYWDDWNDYRDGQRDWYSDRKKIKYTPLKCCLRTMWNNKNKRLLKIRKIRKSGDKNEFR